MAYELRWTVTARGDLREIVQFISRDSARRAHAFAFRVVSHIAVLQQQPLIGHVVPGVGRSDIRQLLLRPYRILYTVDDQRRLVEIARIWHSARGTPEIPGA